MGSLYPACRQGRRFPFSIPARRGFFIQPQAPDFGAEGGCQRPISSLPVLSPAALLGTFSGGFCRLSPDPLVPLPLQETQTKVLVQPHQCLRIREAKKPHHQVDHRTPSSTDKAVEPLVCVGKIGVLSLVDRTGDPPPGRGGEAVAEQHFRHRDTGFDLLRRAHAAPPSNRSLAQ